MRYHSVMFSMFALGNATFACGVRSARKWSFEEASSETQVGRHLLALEPHPLPPLALVPRTCKPKTSDRRGHYFAWNWTIPVVMLATVVATTATLLSNSCNIFDAFFFHFTETIRWERMFLREANSYKWALALRNSRLFWILFSITSCKSIMCNLYESYLMLNVVTSVEYENHTIIDTK